MGQELLWCFSVSSVSLLVTTCSVVSLSAFPSATSAAASPWGDTPGNALPFASSSLGMRCWRRDEKEDVPLHVPLKGADAFTSLYQRQLWNIRVCLWSYGTIMWLVSSLQPPASPGWRFLQCDGDARLPPFLFRLAPLRGGWKLRLDCSTE